MPITILLADDHHVVRKGLALLLGSEKDFEVAGEATNGKEAIEKAMNLKPDIIVMDLFMPVLDGIQATRKIMEMAPDSKILILTSFSDKEHTVPALEAGASGYLLKESDPEEVIRAIRQIMQGEKQIHSKVAAGLFEALQNEKVRDANPYHTLTKREKEVLSEIAKGKSNKEIASSLFITEKTVKTHVSNLLSKLELQDRTQAALFAVKHDLA